LIGDCFDPASCRVGFAPPVLCGAQPDSQPQIRLPSRRLNLNALAFPVSIHTLISVVIHIESKLAVIVLQSPED
jgi:hypothetical protein